MFTPLTEDLTCAKVQHTALSSVKRHLSVNSTPVKSQVAHLEVVIPPRIEDDQSSSDVAVPEGGSVKLHCKAVGFPQ